MKNPKIIIGVDVGTSKFGVAALLRVTPDWSWPFALSSSSQVRVPLLDDATRRIMWVRNRMEMIRHISISTLADNDDQLWAFENPPAARQGGAVKNLHTYSVLQRAAGVLEVSLLDVGCQVIEFTPAECKVAMTGNGRASKDEVRSAAGMLFEAELASRGRALGEDEADALAAAMAGVAWVREQLLKDGAE